MSLVMDDRTCVRFSRSMPAWSEPTSSWDHMTSLVIRTPHGAFAAMWAAVSRAAPSNSSSRTTRRTSPLRSASPASMMRPVSINSHAREAPINRGRSQLTPMSQPESPRRTKATLKRAVLLAMRMSLARARARPPPAAGPLTAAITGWGSERKRGTSEAMWVWVAKVVPTRSRSSAPGALPYPARSSPAQKPRPAPVRTTTRQARSTAMSASASWSSAINGAFMAFNRSGRSRVIRVTASSGWSICSVSMVGSHFSARPYPATHDTAARPLGAALGREPHMGLHYSSVVDAPLAEVFAWHERSGALLRLLPPWQPIKVAQQAQSLADGRAVLQLPGRVRWVAQHSGDDPPHRFVDELVSLPLHC